MRKLIFILPIIILQSCATTDIKKSDKLFNYNKILSDTSKSYLYKTEINLYDNYFSGIMVFKPKKNGHRVVFMNEIGMKFFDIELLADSFKIHQIFEPMNKKMLIKLLVNDFNVLLMNNLSKGIEFYIENETNTNIIKIINKKELYYLNNLTNVPEKAVQYSTLKKHTFIRYENYNEQIPGLIHIKHTNLKFEIILSLIK